MSKYKVVKSGDNSEDNKKKVSNKISNKKNEINKKKTKNGRFSKLDILFLTLQLLLTIASFVLLIWFFFNHKLLYILQLVIGLTMFVICYNYKYIYNKPRLVPIYLVAGVGIILFDLVLWVFNR